MPTDPDVQASDLGNDALASTRYGIANLQYIVAHIQEWRHSNDTNDRFSTKGNTNNSLNYTDPFEVMPASRLDLQRYYFDLLGHLLPLRNDPEVRSFLDLQLSQGYLFLKHPSTDVELEKMREEFITRLHQK